jgi:hypothetical protein
MPARNPGESESSGGGEPRPYEKNISRYAQLFTTLCIEHFLIFLPPGRIYDTEKFQFGVSVIFDKLP